MKLTTNPPTNRRTMRKRIIKLWSLQDDGRKLYAGTIVAGSPAELVAMWAAFLVTADPGVYFATYRGTSSARKRPSKASLCRWRPDLNRSASNDRERRHSANAAVWALGHLST
jgi:hypothetical protein